MKITKIVGEACKKTRSLWEEVFYEDSVQFTDYYFENKAEKNIGYVIGEAPYDAMMFRTPYTLQIGDARKEISYIVGVATRKECRHRGLMRSLLMHSFQKMYEEKQPFTFLMPANPAIYEPFDFRYIYERDVWKIKEGVDVEAYLETEVEYVTSDGQELRAAGFEDSGNYRSYTLGNGLYRVSKLQEQFPYIPILDMLAEFANGYLNEHYNIYVHRNRAYYEMQLKESKAQNGDIYVLLEEGEIKAFFLYAKEEDEVFIQEVMEKEEGLLDFLKKTDEKKPIIMARIIHLEEMLKLVCSKEDKEVVLQVKDELIPENTGVYRWEMTPKGSQVVKIQSKNDAEKELKAAWIDEESEIFAEEKTETAEVISVHIHDLAVYVLRDIFLNEIV